MKINPADFYNILVKEEVDFFTGVPDSTLKHFCFYLDDNSTQSNHIIAANEGNSIAIAAGYHFSTGKIPLVYMQNSGIGNALNPITSLADKEIFGVPMLVLVGWRGEPGKKDAIQHLKDGVTQIELLNSLGLSHTILRPDKQSLKLQIQDSIEKSKSAKSPHIILVSKDSF